MEGKFAKLITTANLYLLMKRLNVLSLILIKISARFFVDIEKIILKFKWKGKGTRRFKTISIGRINMGRISLPNFKVPYIATVIKTHNRKN